MKAAPSTRRRPRRIIRRDRLMVSASQSAKLRNFASLLDIRPEDFLGWILSDHIKSLGSLHERLLAEWADLMLVYETPEQAMEVSARVHAWLDRRRASLEAAELKGGRKP